MDKKNFKAMLKKFKLLYELNATIKAFQLKKNINKVKDIIKKTKTSKLS